jgi:hypothetical protein
VGYVHSLSLPTNERRETSETGFSLDVAQSSLCSVEFVLQKCIIGVLHTLRLHTYYTHTLALSLLLCDCTLSLRSLTVLRTHRRISRVRIFPLRLPLRLRLRLRLSLSLSLLILLRGLSLPLSLLVRFIALLRSAFITVVQQR